MKKDLLLVLRCSAALIFALWVFVSKSFYYPIGGCSLAEITVMVILVGIILSWFYGGD